MPARTVALAALLSVSALAAVTAPAHADPVKLQPGPNGKDVLLYSGFGGGVQAYAGDFRNILAVGGGPAGPTASHFTRTLIKFDLTGVTLNPGEKATLGLYVRNNDPVGESPSFGVSPTPGLPITVSVLPATQPWTETVVTWNSYTATATTGATITSTVVDSIGKYYTFDVTPQVQAWIDNPATNLGFELRGNTVVSGRTYVYAIFDSSAAANRPYLEVAAVPEPASALAGTLALGILAARRRRA